MSEKIVAKSNRIMIGLMRGGEHRVVELTIAKIHEKPTVEITINSYASQKTPEVSCIIDTLERFGYVFQILDDMEKEKYRCVTVMFLPSGVSFVENFLSRLIDALKLLPWKSIVMSDLASVFEIDGKETTAKEYLEKRWNQRSWLVAFGNRFEYNGRCIFDSTDGPDITEEKAMKIFGLTGIDDPLREESVGHNMFVRFIDLNKQAEAEQRIIAVYGSGALKDPGLSIVLVETTKKD